AHGQTASNAADICSTPRSSNRRPTICRPTGRPSLVKPQGTDAAGFCDRLKGEENSAHDSQSHGRCGQCLGCSSSAGKAATDTAGVSMKSQSSKRGLVSGEEG